MIKKCIYNKQLTQLYLKAVFRITWVVSLLYDLWCTMLLHPQSEELGLVLRRGHNFCRSGAGVLVIVTDSSFFFFHLCNGVISFLCLYIGKIQTFLNWFLGIFLLCNIFYTVDSFKRWREGELWSSKSTITPPHFLCLSQVRNFLPLYVSTSVYTLCSWRIYRQPNFALSLYNVVLVSATACGVLRRSSKTHVCPFFHPGRVVVSLTYSSHIFS